MIGLKNKRKKGIIATVLLAGIVLFCYILLEIYFYNDIDCSCVIGFYPTLTSRIIGYALLIFSTLLFIASIWRIKNLSRWWIVPALFIFGIAFYGNGYMLYTKHCTPSITKVTFFIHKTEIGEFVKKYELTNADSLETGKSKGKLLGYSISGKDLTLYRIGDKPLKIKTSFLFWKVRPNIFIHSLPLTYRNVEFENNNKGYEFIGGQDMPIEVFLNEFIIEKNEFAGIKLKNQRIIAETDGTTRFRFEIE